MKVVVDWIDIQIKNHQSYIEKRLEAIGKLEEEIKGFKDDLLARQVAVEELISAKEKLNG